MQFGVCPLSMIAVHTAASVGSEMCTQLLFGELVEVMERKGKEWLKIRCQADHHIGWVKCNQLIAITQGEFELFQQSFAYCLEVTHPLMANQHFVPITIGARLPQFNGMQFQLGDERYQFSGLAVEASEVPHTAELVQKIARRYLHSPYLHGGRSPFGIDSAGLVQIVLQMVGIALPREAAQQMMFGETIDFVEQTQIGDLAFFEDRVGRVNHVGMLMEEQKIMHAYGKVKIDQLDHFGIFDANLQQYTHKLRVIRRILPTTSPKEALSANLAKENKIIISSASLFD